MADQNTTDPVCIWLEPGGPHEERSWCQDDVWTGNPDYEGAKPTEYVRADLHRRILAENKRLWIALVGPRQPAPEEVAR